MRCLLAALLLVSSALGSPVALKTVAKYGGQVNTGSFIVKFKDGVSVASAETLGGGANISHDFWDKSFFNGFAGKAFVITAVDCLFTHIIYQLNWTITL